jgi:hypothetical protein
MRLSRMGEGIGVAHNTPLGTLWRPNPPEQAGFTTRTHALTLVLVLAVMRPIVSSTVAP